MKVGDLVMCTGGRVTTKRVGVIQRIMCETSYRETCYVVFFFDPPDSNWNNGVWFDHAMEVICAE